MDVSGVITGASDPSKVRLTLDLVPDKPLPVIEDWLDRSRRNEGRRKVVAAIAEWIPKRLAEAIALDAGAGDHSFAELPKTAMTKLASHLKQLSLPVTGTRGYEKAEVTAGGVSLREVDPRTMQSRIVPGLFIAGEILDLDGWIGGYNFQSAFSTGYVAGLHAVT
jgi:predicted Rossmann fold flavoprotein